MEAVAKHQSVLITRLRDFDTHGRVGCKACWATLLTVRTDNGGLGTLRCLLLIGRLVLGSSQSVE